MNENDYVIFDPKIPRYKPILTNFLIVLISIMFIIELYFTFKYGEKGVILLGAKWNEGITNGEYWRFFTCALLHGNFMHLFLNLAGVYIFGKELESIYGTLRFMAICLLTSWGAALASYLYSPGVAIGASGIVFGIIGCLISFYFKQKNKMSGAEYRFKSMYTLIILNIVFGLFIPKIDNSAHIGGALSGLICGWLLSPKYKTIKNEELQRLKVVEEKRIINLTFNVFFLICLFILLTKLGINKFI